MTKDYYKTLGVEKNASAEDIKKAFRKLAHEHHPDKTGGDDKKFKEALEAYQVLSNDEKRKQYDQFGTTFDQAGAPGGPGGFDFSSFGNGGDFGDLSDILGGMFGFGGGGRASSRRSRGSDIEKDITLTFEESVFGTTKPIELYRQSTCERCDGSGGEPGTKVVSCDDCRGSGQVTRVTRTMLGNFQMAAVCEACQGTGKKPEKRCVRCSGSGITRELIKREIKIPAGADDGAVIRVTGEGEAAPYSGTSGDLYLRLRVKSSNKFERKGFDIYSRLLISFTIAALGGKVEVETVDGPVELKIPAGTQSESLFRLRGKGVPNTHRGGRGDHLVEVTIEVPTKLSKKQKKLLEEFDEK